MIRRRASQRHAHCEEQLILELRKKESQQHQQIHMFMQLGMTAMMVYMGVKKPKPDDDNDKKRFIFFINSLLVIVSSHLIFML